MRKFVRTPSSQFQRQFQRRMRLNHWVNYHFLIDGNENRLDPVVGTSAGVEVMTSHTDNLWVGAHIFEDLLCRGGARYCC